MFSTRDFFSNKKPKKWSLKSFTIDGDHETVRTSSKNTIRRYWTRRLSRTIYQSNPLDDPKGNRVVLSSFRHGKIRLTSLGTILQSKGLYKVSPFLLFLSLSFPREGWKIGDRSEEEGRLDNSPMAIPCINIVRWISTGEAFVSRNRSRGEMIQNRETSNPLRELRIDSRRGKLLECEFPGNLLYNTFLLLSLFFFFLIFLLYIYI